MVANQFGGCGTLALFDERVFRGSLSPEGDLEAEEVVDSSWVDMAATSDDGRAEM